MHAYFKVFIFYYIYIICFITIFAIIVCLLEYYKLFSFKLDFKYLLPIVFFTIFVCTILKIYLNYSYNQIFISTLSVNNLSKLIKVSQIQNSPYIYDNYFGDFITLLASVTGLIVFQTINIKFLYNPRFKCFFLFFILLAVCCVTTTNMLVMYACFELLFVPTIVVLNITDSTTTLLNSLKKLIFWTLFGIFLILTGFGFLYAKYRTLNYDLLRFAHFSTVEVIFLYCLFFFGFSVKIPLVPFHFWLLKIHVDAPVGLSMFLSGFLVKISIYCFYNLHNLFFNKTCSFFVLSWTLLSVCLSTLSFYTLQDIKRLVAWTTIQEMSILVFLMLLKNNTHTQIIFFFLFFHGILSIFMFYLVELIEMRYQTREISLLSGIMVQTPVLGFYIWLLILIFCSIPFSFKFLVEFELFNTLFELNSLAVLYCFLVLFLITIISICKLFFGTLYGTTINKHKIVDLGSNEIFTLNFLLFLMSICFYWTIF